MSGFKGRWNRIKIIHIMCPGIHAKILLPNFAGSSPENFRNEKRRFKWHSFATLPQFVNIFTIQVILNRKITMFP